MQLIAERRLRISPRQRHGRHWAVNTPKPWPQPGLSTISRSHATSKRISPHSASLRPSASGLGFRRGLECSLVGDVNRHHHA